MEKKLYRSLDDSMLAGVCGGIGEYFDVDPTLIRILFVGFVVFGFGSPIVLYIIMALIMPVRPAQVDPSRSATDVATDDPQLRPVADKVSGVEEQAHRDLEEQ